MSAVGIDGCRNGWISVCIHASGSWNVGTHSLIADAWASWRTGLELALIDIPIGLRDSGGQPRLCEVEARRLLSKRRSSVFTPPVRSSLACATYEAASANNFMKSGRKLSRQSWGIAPKIRQVDVFLATEPEARRLIREAHPEVLFCKLNGNRPMSYSKKDEPGFQERLSLASKYFPAAHEVVAEVRNRYRKSQVSDDDVLDALIEAIAANRCLQNGVVTLPRAPETDSVGLPMEMVFAG